MALYSPEFIRRVREANDIARVVESYGIPLRRAGRNLIGLCPFHQEKTPSFNVSAVDQFFKCFGCGEKGDVISFVQKMARVDFMGAVAELAGRAGLAPEFADPRAAAAARRDGDRRTTLRKLVSRACRYFEDALWRPDAGGEAAAHRALDYLRGRGFTDETLHVWRVGWAPDRWDGFLTRLAHDEPRHAADPEAWRRLLDYAVAAGLVRRKEDERGGASRAYDFFRDRVMFPIVDARHEPVGFGGRLMEERPGVGKYVNSPENPLFEKRKILFGLAQAAKDIALAGEALVVEGYVDVIMCHQFGIRHAVATLGTALTEDHLRILRRHLPSGGRIVGLFDADDAGERAGRRAAELCMAEGVPFAVVRGLPHKDPGEFLPKMGAEAFRRHLAGAEDSFAYLVRRELGDAAPRDVGARAAAVGAVMAVVNLSKDPVKRAFMRKAVAAEAGVPESTLPEPADESPAHPAGGGRMGLSEGTRGSGRFVRTGGGSPRGRPGTGPDGGASGGMRAPDTVALALRAQSEGLRRRYIRLLRHMWANRDWCLRIADAIPPDRIWDPSCHEVARLIMEAWDGGAEPTGRDLLSRATEPGSEAVIVDLAMGQDDLAPSEAELVELLGRFTRERREEAVRGVMEALERAQREGEVERERELLGMLQALKREEDG